MTFVEKYQNSGAIFGEKLKELRLLAKRKAVVASKELKISPKQYARWEAGDLPPWDKLLRICDYYEYDFLCLLFGANSSTAAIGQISDPDKIELDLQVISYAVSRISERLQVPALSKLDNANMKANKDSADEARTPGKAKKG